MNTFWISDMVVSEFDGFDFSTKNFRETFSWFFSDEMKNTFPKIISETHRMLDWLEENVPGYYFSVNVMPPPDEKLTIGLQPDGSFGRVQSYRIILNIPVTNDAMLFKLMFNAKTKPLEDDELV